MGFKAAHWPLALLLATFVALATLYNVANPIFEAPDELWHYHFVKHLADGGGLPVLQEDPRQNVAGQEGGQPPLYYALAALATFWIDTGDLESVSLGIGEGPNFFVHTAREDFPYQGATLAVHLARGVSTLISAITVLLTYLIGLEALKGQRPLALAGAALVAFIPQFLFISASVNNDNLLTALSALVLLLVMRAPNRGLTIPSTLLLGATLAAAALVKVSGLALLPLALAALGLRAWLDHSPAPFRACLAVFPLVALGAGWWYIRNWSLYGDPLGLGLFITAAGGATTVLTLGYLLEEVEGVWTSLWAVFGWFNVPAAPGFYAWYGVLSLLGVLGLVRLVADRERRSTTLRASTAAINLLWVAVYVALVFQYMRMITGMQGRLLFPALPALGLLLAAGLAALVPTRWLRMLPAALGTVLFIPALLAPFLYILPAYNRVVLLDESQVRAIPHRVDINYGNLVQLLGYRLENPSPEPGRPLGITLYWQALSSPGKNYTLFLHAFDAWGNALGGVDALLGKGYPTAAWRTGEALEESYTIPLSEPQDRPSLIRLEAGLYLYPTLERLPALDPQGRPLGTSVTVVRVKAAALSPQPPTQARQIPLGDQLLLVGYQGPDVALRPGQTVEGHLWWKALERPRRDYTVFVQLVGPGGLVAQYDAQPRGNSYPTSLWDAEEVVEDFFQLSIPPGTPPGLYRLIAGMYDPVSGERLGKNGEDYVLLEEVTVGAGLASQ